MTRKKGGRTARIIILLLLLSFLYYENFTIEAERIGVSSPRLPESFDGFRIVQISDLQGREFGEGNQTLLETVREQDPDIIVITGDLIDDISEMEIVPGVAEGLSAIAPAFYVTGNHEWAVGNVKELSALLAECGVTVLANEYKLLELGGERIVLAGVHDPLGPYDMKTPEDLTAEIREKNGDMFVVLLAHRNDLIDQWAGLGLDVVLCGHGHGGIIRLPFTDGLISTSRTLFPEYTNGLYTKDDTQMVVSRGLGNSVINFRLFNRPHIPVIVLSNR